MAKHPISVVTNHGHSFCITSGHNRQIAATTAAVMT